MNKKLMDAISKGRPGKPVLIEDLRHQIKMSKAAFDSAILELAKSGRYFLTKEARPLGSLSDAETAAMVPAGEDGYFMAINIRESSPIPAETKKASRGGSRSGAGRPAKKVADKRKSLTVRLPVWLVEYLDGKAGKKIEAALIEKYKLTPLD